MKKVIAFLSALLVAVICVLCLNRVPVGYVGVVYSASGVEQKTSYSLMIRLITTRKSMRIGTLMHPPAAAWSELT